MEATVIEIHKWEEKVIELERKEGFVLKDNFKMAALAELCPNEIRSLIYVQVDLTDYKSLKEKVVAWVANQTVGRLGDVGNISDCTCGTCGEEEDVNALQCYTCGGVGHPARLCPTEKGKGKGKGKGMGKGP